MRFIFDTTEICNRTLCGDCISLRIEREKMINRYGLADITCPHWLKWGCEKCENFHDMEFWKRCPQLRKHKMSESIQLRLCDENE